MLLGSGPVIKGFFVFLNCALVQGLAKFFCKGPDRMYLSLGELNDVLVFYAE